MACKVIYPKPPLLKTIINFIFYWIFYTFPMSLGELKVLCVALFTSLSLSLVLSPLFPI